MTKFRLDISLEIDLFMKDLIQKASDYLIENHKFQQANDFLASVSQQTKANQLSLTKLVVLISIFTETELEAFNFQGVFKTHGEMNAKNPIFNLSDKSH